MKNKILSIILLICTLFSLNEIYAYNLTYTSVLKESNGKYEAIIRQTSKASPSILSLYSSSTKNSSGWVEITSSNSSSFQSVTTAFNFGSDVMSNYTEGFVNKTGYINLYYDYTESSLQAYDSSTEFTGKRVSVLSTEHENFNEAQRELVNLNGTDAYVLRFKVEKINGIDVCFTDYVISSEKLNIIVSKLQGGARSSMLSVKVSNVVDGHETLSRYVASSNLNDNKNGMDSDENYVPLVSIANFYDNNLIIPTGNSTGREIYVRHINKETGDIITYLSNSYQEVIASDGKQILINNTNSTDATFSYNEYYRYSIDSIMNITKSLVIKSNAKTYRYLGANVCTMNSAEDALTIMNQKRSSYRAGLSELDIMSNNQSNTSSFTTKNSSSNDVTIIDFYYTEQNTDVISPRLLSNTNVWNTNDASMIGDITYVPAGGEVLPYFITPKYVVKDLSYQKVIQNGKVRYQVNDFKVYRMMDSYLKSSDTINKDGINISGHLIGDTFDTVFAGLSEVISLPIKNSMQDEVTNELNTLLLNSVTDDIPGNNEIDRAIAENAGPSDYEAGRFIVNYSRYNGLRSAKGNVTYTTYDVINGVNTDSFERESVNEHFINVYTPVQLAMPEVSATNAASVNHSVTSSSTAILSDDATFRIKLQCTNSNFAYYNNVTDAMRANFVEYYYVIFDFDIVYNGVTYPKGTIIRKRNTASTENGITYFDAVVAPNETLSRSSTNHKIIVLASSSNMHSNELLQYVVDQEVAIQVNKTMDVQDRKYINDSGNNEVSFLNDINSVKSYSDPQYTGGYRFYADGYYFAMQTITVRTMSRIYDFKISDCTDLAFKNVFRKANSSDTDINSLTGNNYYAGIRRLFIYTNNNKEFTTLIDRDNIAINGTSSTKTLPLGPYKHTTAGYMSAPKLGYRIAFDLKTTGYYKVGDSPSKSRGIRITPSYYYISKDGSTIEKDITLYYKDSSGKYKKFEGSNYTIYFTPNNGYRYQLNSTTMDVSSLSTKSEGLNIASSNGYFELTDAMMSSDDTGYTQSWYGEFKLPNTTVATVKGDKLDNILKDGYIGVKFDITCIDLNLNETVSYNRNNISVAAQTNTTQWDYEGFLGFSSLGQMVTPETSVRLQLEKGIWSINSQELYEFIKGTVLLYDIDDRAADDIQ